MSGSKVIDVLMNSWKIQGWIDEVHPLLLVSFDLEFTVQPEPYFLKTFRFVVEAKIYNPKLRFQKNYTEAYATIPIFLN